MAKRGSSKANSALHGRDSPGFPGRTNSNKDGALLIPQAEKGWLKRCLRRTGPSISSGGRIIPSNRRAKVGKRRTRSISILEELLPIGAAWEGEAPA